MGTEQTITLERVLEINMAVASVENNTKLDFTTSYRLGRLQANLKPVIKSYGQTENKYKVEANKLITELKKGYAEKTDAQKEEINTQIQDISNEFKDKIEALMEQEETVKIPELKLKDFEGKDIPVKFFSLMGEAIKD